MRKEKFKIEKAYELRLTYKKRRQYSKENLISQLIMWYNFNSDCIIDSTITVVGRYQTKTVEDVCNDLGYRLCYVQYSTIKGLYGKEYGSYTNFLFESRIDYFGDSEV